MTNHVKLVEFVSTNEDARKELEALRPELEGKSEQERIDAFVKFAAKHGFTLTAEDFAANMQELSKEELKAVAGGDSDCGEAYVKGYMTVAKCGWCNYTRMW
ncbi:MAG: Nif11-like leader peptide family RiPP precursor [Synergistaceae bacterium]|nr:Nif11-like leader peptide family RiPP precursor [Synergistaceae bacterium]MBQ3695313.1 Nif11-like leader peptide family RiPP precursor [Synergistaceae bacterium]MBQ6112074.1 Nif11-like leader peptide family RiPP precursor [Synergistaceae bacterium]MBQ9629878.1 Nif11-like leader peptide family RiPP precursor [Synergistaceae bacterium]MBR0070656.1 Nif11-like leader peptide family RiPP precursor [Synergistaceae bacterium]